MFELIFRNIENMFSFFISVSKINWLSHSLIAYGYLTDKNDKKYLFIILLSKHREVLMYVQCTYYVWRIGIEHDTLYEQYRYIFV